MTFLRFVSAGALALSVAACADTMTETAAPEWTAMDRAVFDDTVVGRNQVSGNASFIMTEDGAFTGAFNDAAFAGTWEWRNGLVCSKIADGPLKSDRCSTPETKEGAIRYRREDGSTSPAYTLE